MTRILICGNARWPVTEAIFDVMNAYTKDFDTDELTFISGMCSGADAMAWYLAHALGVKCDEYPMNEEGRKKIMKIMGDDYKEGYRNQWMLDSGVDICFAFAFDLRTSIGTRDMVNRCIGRDVPTFWSDGETMRRVLLEVSKDTIFSQDMEEVDWKGDVDAFYS